MSAVPVETTADSAQVTAAGTCFSVFCTWIVDTVGVEAGLDELAIGGLEGGLRRQLTEEAGRIWYRVLLEEFHSFRERGGWLDDPLSSTALALFDQQVQTLEGRERIASTWSVPLALTRSRYLAAITYARQVENAYVEDRDRLVSKGFLGSTFMVDDVRFGAGDSHNGGKTVAILSNSDGESVVYKPRSSQPDTLLEQLCLQLSRASRHVDLTRAVPKTLSSRQGFWQEYIEKEDVTDAAGVTSYFRTFGSLAALSSAIGAVDLHHENIVIRGSSPCVVDSETILQPEQAPESDQVRDKLLSAGEHSPGATLMLPMRVRNGAFDVLVCALGLPWEQESQKETFTVLDEGTDAVRLERINVRMRHDDNVLRLSGTEINPVEHLGEIVEGYLAVVDALAHQHEAIKAILRGAGKMHFRVVPRPTEVYAKFLDASAHPSFVTGHDSRNEVLEILQPLEIDADRRVMAAERHDLQAFDVPAFYVVGNSLAVSWVDHEVTPNVFAKSPVDSAVATLDDFIARPRMFHEAMLETSLNEMSVGLGIAYPAPLMATHLHGDPAAVSKACRSLLGDTAVRGIENGRPAAGWVSNLGHEGLSTFEIDTVQTFHDFGGVVDYLVSRYPESELATLSGALPRVSDDRNPLPTQRWSIFGGPLSSLLAGRVSVELGPELAQLRETPGCQDIDLMGGLSGLLALVSQSEQVNTSWILDARETLRRVRHIPLTRPWHDLAHGQIGLDWALFRAAHRLGDDSAGGEAARILSGIANALETQEIGPAWCSGASGLLVVAADLHRLGYESGPHIGKLAELAAASPDGPVDLSVCHGISGAVQSLSFAGSTGALDGGEQQAAQLWEKSLHAAGQNGFHTGVVGRTTVLGYMLGWAGVADTADRLTHGAGVFDPVALIPAPSRKGK